MVWCKRMTACLLALLGSGGGALACEEFVDLAAQELKEYRDKLVEQEADPLDRMFAFQQLACSSSPVMRAYAVREGLRTATDPIVRQQIMFDSLMQKTRLDIELTADSKVTAGDKNFIKEQSGVWVLQVPFQSSQEGCLSLHYGDRCEKQYSAFVRGDKLELTYNYTVGEFYLSDTNELVGYVRIRDNANFGRIPAVIKLN